ncbi:MAG: hypothetical protein LWW93_02970 [Hyphomicrobiales bacterium]|nr:hypothetical protein [Hyphomicrobiales bacterium]
MTFLIPALLAIVIWVAATVVFGYAGLIIGALIAVAAMYAFILALTASGMFAKKGGSAH